jgi:ADP-ribose pyrophosphatase YjhB (NUDIX family)
LLTFKADIFNGITINALSLPLSHGDVKSSLENLIAHARSDNKRLIWLTLPIDKSDVIPLAIQLGFVFHNCSEQEVTLILRLVADAYAPFVPTHSIGAGALVINDDNQVLVIRERLATGKGYKLPGGHIELGENIHEAVAREVFEETGIKACFKELVGFASKHPYQFGKSNIYFICRLVPLTHQIEIQDTHEIADARWVDLECYISDENNSEFNRELVNKLRNVQGLVNVELDFNQGQNGKKEIFFAQHE